MVEKRVISPFFLNKITRKFDEHKHTNDDKIFNIGSNAAL